MPAAWSGRSNVEKKTPLERDDPRRSVTALLDGYELLRKSVLEDDNYTAVGCGLSVLLSQGMAAWMKLFTLMAAPSHTRPREVAYENDPGDLASRVALLMADIFLRQQEESKC